MKKILGGFLVFAAFFFIQSSNAFAAVDTCTWTGGSTGNLGDGSEWSGCDNGGVPQNNDNLVIDAEGVTGGITINNNTSSMMFGTIIIRTADSSHSGVVINGNPLNANNGMTVYYGSSSTSNPASIVINTGVNFQSPFAITAAGASSGQLTITGSVGVTNLKHMGVASTLILTGSNGNLGNINMESGLLRLDVTSANQDTILGDTSTYATTFTGGRLQICGVGGAEGSSRTISKDLVFTNATDVYIGGTYNGSSCDQLLYGYDTLTLSGDISLANNVTMYGNPYWHKVKLTGALSGATKTIAMLGHGTLLHVDGSSNTTATQNGLVKPEEQATSIGDGDTVALGFRIGYNDIVSYGKTAGTDALTVLSGGTLKGSGVTSGTVAVHTDGTIAPGNSPGCLTVGNLVLQGTLNTELNGKTACTEYDQLRVNGTVDISGSTLDLDIITTFKPTLGDTYTILSNDSNDAITGTFTGLTEGATLTVDGYTFSLSYTGGDGNDIVLTLTGMAPNAAGTTPGTPKTGFALIAANPLATLALTTISAVSLYVLSRKFTAKSYRR